MTLALHRPFMFSVEALLSRSTGGSEDVFVQRGPGWSRRTKMRVAEIWPAKGFRKSAMSKLSKAGRLTTGILDLSCHSMPYHAIPYHAMPLSGAESHARF